MSRVYFARSGNLIKIGTAAHGVQSRIAGINTMSPLPVVLLKEIAGGPQREKEIHRMWSKERVRGEWFNASEALMQFIDELPGAEPEKGNGHARPLTVVVKVNDEEYLALDKQADIQGVTRSDVLRGFVRGLPTFSGATRRDA